LAGKNVGGNGLVNLGSAFDDFASRFHIKRFDLNDLLAVDHAGVRQLRFETGIGKNHINEADFEHGDTFRVILSGKCLDKFSGRRRGPHAVGNGARKRRVRCNIRIDVDRVVI